MSSEVVSRASAFRGGPIIASADEHLWANINRRPFVFRHTLGNNPLLELPRLAELAVRAAHRNQRGHFFSRKGPGEDLSLADRIRQLDEREDWIKISYANELDPDYAEIHDALLDELAALSQIPIRESMSWSGMTIFMNSPNLAVPYHFDHETNFLMQVRGTKTVDLFDQTDRSVLTEAEIESFLSRRRDGRSIPSRFGKSCVHIRIECWGRRSPPAPRPPPHFQSRSRLDQREHILHAPSSRSARTRLPSELVYAPTEAQTEPTRPIDSFGPLESRLDESYLTTQSAQSKASDFFRRATRQTPGAYRAEIGKHARPQIFVSFDASLGPCLSNLRSFVVRE